MLDGRGGKGVVQVVRADPQIPARRLISFTAQLMGRAALALAEIENLPVAQAVEIFHAHIGAAEIVDRHIAFRRVPQVFAHEHRRHAAQKRAQIPIALGVRRQEDHTVHLAADHEFKEDALLFRTAQGIAQDNIVSPVPGLSVNIVCHLRHKRIGDIRHNQAEQLCAFHHHGAGNRVRGIIHLPAQLQNALPGLFADLRTPRQGPGNRRVGDARGPRDILDGHLLHRLHLRRKNLRCIFVCIVAEKFFRSKKPTAFRELTGFRHAECKFSGTFPKTRRSSSGNMTNTARHHGNTVLRAFDKPRGSG